MHNDHNDEGIRRHLDFIIRPVIRQLANQSRNTWKSPPKIYLEASSSRCSGSRKESLLALLSMRRKRSLHCRKISLHWATRLAKEAFHSARSCAAGTASERSILSSIPLPSSAFSVMELYARLARPSTKSISPDLAGEITGSAAFSEANENMVPTLPPPSCFADPGFALGVVLTVAAFLGSWALALALSAGAVAAFLLLLLLLGSELLSWPEAAAGAALALADDTLPNILCAAEGPASSSSEELSTAPSLPAPGTESSPSLEPPPRFGSLQHEAKQFNRLRRFRIRGFGL